VSGEILAGVIGAKTSTFVLGRFFGWIGGLLAPEEAAVKLSSGQMGKIIGWGTGQADEAVAQTIARTGSLTTEEVQQMAAKDSRKNGFENNSLPTASKSRKVRQRN
jgi:hypothetical protein